MPGTGIQRAAFLRKQYAGYTCTGRHSIIASPPESQKQFARIQEAC